MLDTGMCHGMSREQIQRDMPREWARFCDDPFTYRIPGGESYFDLVQRMSSFVIELERETRAVLIVSHLSTLQVLYGYLIGHPPHRSHSLQVPRHTLIELTPTNYGWSERRLTFDESGADEVAPSPVSAPRRPTHPLPLPDGTLDELGARDRRDGTMAAAADAAIDAMSEHGADAS